MTCWRGLSTGQKIAVTVGVSAGTAIIYICYIKYWKFWKRRDSKTSPLIDTDVELHITVPQEAVKLLVGRGGTIRKRLKKQSEAHIEVTEIPNGKGEHELTIKGTPSQVSQAKEAVYGIMNENAVLRVEILIPNRCVCRIIGQGGDRIRSISKNSGAKIQCEKRTSETEMAQTRRVTIIGTKEQIDAAKGLIQKLSEEEEHVKQRAAESSAFRCRRKEIIAVKKREGEQANTVSEETFENCNLSEAGDGTISRTRTSSKGGITDTTYEVSKFEVPSPDFTFRADEYVDIYVSATENPEHFWIQILGTRSSQLDKLTTEMSEYYQNQQQAMPEIRVGDIVAAPFHTDTFWYRAEVQGFVENGNVDLYYVDYGDNWDTARKNLFPLRSDFLSLPFQAIECSLFGISPAGAEWSQQALNEFDDLTHCAKWKPLLAKISSFPSPGVCCYFQVQLFDPSTDPIVNIGNKLISKGFAVERKQIPVRADDDDDKLVAQLVEEVTSLSLEFGKGTFASRQEQHQLSTDGSFDLLRSDVEHVAASSLEPPCRLMSTPLNYPASAVEEESLEEVIAKIKISNDERSVASSETTPPALSSNSSTLSSDSSTSSSSNSSNSSNSSIGQSLLSSPMDDSSIYSPRGCFYYLTSEETSTSTGFNSSSCDIITISSESEDEQTQTEKARSGEMTVEFSDALLSSGSDDDVILVED
ncbi:tudor and KH domain-containing protein [Bombina bombina]|uniref:tudor and KH domain-containing protein n=1 Tax=Bombina bombina TaxID=8345 RepID=UPI00235A4B14|nr:tudor and KH domain-containing protein [Bombina bombina]